MAIQLHTPLFALILISLCFASDFELRADEKVQFNRDIRPILSENCFHCHGPDNDGRAADLRLDERQAAVEYGAIVPGSPEDSFVIERINSLDPYTKMPPKESHKNLTEEQKALISRWISEGAEYEKHWSFEPISEYQTDLGIDDYINAKLAKKNIKASPEATRERLLRRLTFDLTGLPPEIAEVDALLADDSPDAYERVVDRLLASPTYGERMATEWLDVARYSDTYGYQVDRDRFVWPWRDWVIRSFNSNLPYDQFITEQLAGDLLPDATQDQILATTFNRLHPQKVEGGSVEEEFRVEYVVDRAQTASTAFMGLTFECARCHDHKFDPLTQQEFYKLNAFFANINEAGLYSYHTDSTPTPTLFLPSGTQRVELAAAKQAVQAAEKAYLQCCRQVQTDSFSDLTAVSGIDGPVALQHFDSPEAQKLKVELVEGVVGKAARLSGDQGVTVEGGRFRRWEPFSISLWLQTPDVKERAVVFHQSLGWTDAASRGYQLLIEEGKLSAALVHFWPGNAINIRTEEQIQTGEWLHVVMTYDGSSNAAGLRLFLNGELAKCDVIQDSLTKDISTKPDNDIVIGERTRDRGFTNGLVDDFEVYDRRLTMAEIRYRFNQIPLTSIMSLESLASLSAVEIKELIIEQIDTDCRTGYGQLQQARKTRDNILDEIQDIMVMQELSEPRATHVLNRGLYDARLEQVSPGTPRALPPMAADAPANRLGLANWLTSRDHPLTARVAVNRYWQMIFGRGLVVTSEDFGSQGSPPSHPELLDHLAGEFIKSGWDVKQLLKKMVLSSAYRRDSTGTSESVAKDPENIWLSRGPIAPLTAEMIRDSALTTSGLLSRKIGGSPAKPYELAVSFKPVEHARGEGLYRRSLYTYWKRTGRLPQSMLVNFDASDREVCCQVPCKAHQYASSSDGCSTDERTLQYRRSRASTWPSRWSAQRIRELNAPVTQSARAYFQTSDLDGHRASTKRSSTSSGTLYEVPTWTLFRSRPGQWPQANYLSVGRAGIPHGTSSRSRENNSHLYARSRSSLVINLDDSLVTKQ